MWHVGPHTGGTWLTPWTNESTMGICNWLHWIVPCIICLCGHRHTFRGTDKTLLVSWRTGTRTLCNGEPCQYRVVLSWSWIPLSALPVIISFRCSSVDCNHAVCLLQVPAGRSPPSSLCSLSAHTARGSRVWQGNNSARYLTSTQSDWLPVVSAAPISVLIKIRAERFTVTAVFSTTKGSIQSWLRVKLVPSSDCSSFVLDSFCEYRKSYCVCQPLGICYPGGVVPGDAESAVLVLDTRLKPRRFCRIERCFRQIPCSVELSMEGCSISYSE